jgi:hypothetical protein
MGHWYDETGKPCHTMPKARGGGTRDTTVRDARKLNLFPSVTTITKSILAAPQLARWLEGQLLKAAYKAPPIGGETYEEWQASIRQKVAIQSEKTMQLGTDVHKALEDALGGMPFDGSVTARDGEDYPLYTFVNPVVELFADNGWRIHSLEETVVGDRYAGTADVQYFGDDEYGIIDFKTTKDALKPFIPDTYVMQIAAYHVAVHGGISDKAAGYNIFISTEQNIGAVKAERYDADRLREEYEAFKRIVWLWCKTNKHWPERENEGA